jgi:hypothetical protein
MIKSDKAININKKTANNRIPMPGFVFFNWPEGGTFRSLKLFITAYIVISTIALFADVRYLNGWKEPSHDEMEKISSYPLFVPEKPTKDLPYQVNNSYQIYFRPVFSQLANECGHASGVGYTFTYEMNYKRNTNANFSQNQFPTYYTFNFLNKGNEQNGSSYLSAWEVIREAGCPYIYDYGGMTPADDPDLRDRLWMSGSVKYESALENRVYEIIAFSLDSEEGLTNLKNWLFDRGNGSSAGGIANFSAGANYSWHTGFLPAGTEHEGELVITKWHTTVNHGMTIAGYNDSIRFDLNGDGRFTKDIDITGDGIVDMRDREIGALLMVNTWGNWWGNEGRAWVLYSTLGYKHWEGGIWTQTAHSIQTFELYEPLLTIRAEMEYTKRDNLKIFAGVSKDTSSFKPEKTLEMSFLNKSGGNSPMSGDSTYIDITLDITPLVKNIENFADAKIFLCIAESDTSSLSEGRMISMSVKDEWGNISHSGQTDQYIADNDTTYLSAILPIYYNAPQITTSTLPEIVPDEEYNAQINWRGGRDPFRWDFVIDYDESENTELFPDGEFTELEFPHDNYDNDIIPVALDFSFPFYGSLYDSIFVSTDGYIVFENKFHYIWNEESVTGNRMIAPFASNLAYYFDLGDGIFFLKDSESITLLWKASTPLEPEPDFIFSAVLHKDGKIGFFNHENLSTGYDWYCGISNGDGINQLMSENNGAHDPSGLETCFISPDFPYGLSINNDGLVQGMISEYGKSWNLTAKITDWNGISSQKDFVLSSTTGINDNNLPEKMSIATWPNPFNPSAAITIRIRNESSYGLYIYNSKGEISDILFNNKMLTPGSHRFVWNPGSLSSGIYYALIYSEYGDIPKPVRMLYLK